MIMSKSQLIDLRGRAGQLCDAILCDPERPYWQVEFIRILDELAMVTELLADDYLSCAGDLSGLKDRVGSLEARYSELLYRMSDRA